MTEKNEDFCAPYMPLVEALLDKHAAEVSVHKLSEISIARSELNARTLKDTACDILDETGAKYRVEGENSTRWTLIDAGDLIVNILSREGRDFYRLDSLWGDAPTKKFTDQDED